MPLSALTLACTWYEEWTPPPPVLRGIYRRVCDKEWTPKRKHKYYNDIGLCARDTNTILDSIVNTFGGACVPT